jgi:hypothetical protein
MYWLKICMEGLSKTKKILSGLRASGSRIKHSVSAIHSSETFSQTRVQWEPGNPSMKIKPLEREADHSPSSSDEVKAAWSYISALPRVFMICCWIEHRNKSAFSFTSRIHFRRFSTQKYLRIILYVQSVSRRVRKLNNIKTTPQYFAICTQC